MSCFKTKLGSHNCTSREKRNSDLAPYGVGTVLYFQLLKYLGFMFFMMFLLSGPAMLFFFYGSDLESTSLTKIVSTLTVGNLGSSEPVCKEGSYDLTTVYAIAKPEGVMNLRCPFGELYELFDFGQLSTNTKV